MFTRIQMIISMIRRDPVSGIIFTVSMMVALLLSLILHECAHGYMALRCGDPTAKMMGRLTLNPAKHLDPRGTIFMLLFGFGWAKPVPVNPRNFRNYRRDDFMVSIAGIMMNMTLFLLSTALIVGIYRHVNSQVMVYVYEFIYMFSSINLSLALFNLLPIPPLDGYHLFNDLVFKGRFRLTRQQFQYAQIGLIVLCFSGILGNFLSTIHETVFDAVLNLFSMMIPH